jgi:hypothetical protein
MLSHFDLRINFFSILSKGHERFKVEKIFITQYNKQADVLF